MRGRWENTGRREATQRILAGYALLAVMACGLAVALRDGSPWVYPEPWRSMPPLTGVAASAVLGVAFALALIVLTRVAIAHSVSARRLHRDLRPVARDLSVGQILVVAGLSSLGEELLFRGLLVPTLGVVISALLFGLAHQIKGPSRWLWVGWATCVGLALGAMFALTGSLVGPLLAHAIVNAVNLTFLRDHDVGAEEVPARLG